MKPKEFIAKLDDARVVAAIAEAEGRTSGEIRVFVSSRALGGDDVQKRAEARFVKLGMAATEERNGVLFYFIPRDRKFAIIGDSGIHEKCGTAFWTKIADALHTRLAAGKFTEGVVEAIARAGTALATHFPRRGDDPNELSDRVERD
jgi:uncharacterized membrane protein